MRPINMTEDEAYRIVNPPLIGFSDADAIVHWYGWPVSFNDFRVLNTLDEAARDVVRRTLIAVRDAERTEIERLRLFERYANSTVEGQVADAIAYKAQNGKYQFED